MKLNDNVDYLNVKSHMQSKYDDIDFLPNSLRNSIKAVLKLCEEQEEYIENCEERLVKFQEKENKKLKQLLAYCFEEGVIGE